MPDIQEIRLKFSDGREHILHGVYLREYILSMGYDTIEITLRLMVPRYVWGSEPDYPTAPQEIDSHAPLLIENHQEDAL